MTSDVGGGLLRWKRKRRVQLEVFDGLSSGKSPPMREKARIKNKREGETKYGSASGGNTRV